MCLKHLMMRQRNADAPVAYEIVVGFEASAYVNDGNAVLSE